MLERYLNSIVMVAGGKDYLLSTPTDEGGGATQGCQEQKTFIPFEILIMLGLATMGLLTVSMSLLVLCILDRREFIGEKITQQMPNDLVGWMVQAVQEHRGEGGVASREIKNWAFGIWPNGRGGITFVGHPRVPSGVRRGLEEEIRLTDRGYNETQQYI